MKKILVPLATYKLSENEPFLHAARQSYIEKLLKYNKIPVFISCMHPLEYIKERYLETEGVLFMGGGDFSPKLYKELPDAKTVVNNELEDEIELEILNWVLRDKTPFLGICRGCQALAIASGGKLHQHIPEVYKDENHGFSEGGITYGEIHDQTGHVVYLESGSKIANLTQKDQILTNSAHHQSVKSLGDSLIVTGKTKSGVVEVIEASDLTHFCFGIQSHPENFVGNDLDCLFREL
jgi:putative glutamine amidotransferase